MGLGRVTEVYPGTDGHVRVVILKTKGGHLKRPIVKLEPLPVKIQPGIAKPTTDIDKPRPAPRRRTRKNFQSCNLLVMLMTIIITFLTPLQGTTTINSLDNNNTLYFDKIANIRIIQGHWKMVVYYNMSTYWKSMTSVKNYIK